MGVFTRPRKTFNRARWNAHVEDLGNWRFLEEILSRHWVSLLFLLATLTVLAMLLCVRWWLKRRWSRLFEEAFDQESDLAPLPPPSPQDMEALKHIKALRREVWQIPESRLRPGVEDLTQKGLHVVRSVAKIYYPDSPSPEYEASLLESLHLTQRVLSRLISLSRATPLKFLGNQKLSDFQRYYRVYRKINESPWLEKIKRYRHVYRAARWAINLKNLGNPIYWVGKELSREGYFFTLRWFHLIFVTQLGREAMRVYSGRGRQFQKQEHRDAALACQRLFALTRRWGGPSGEEWAFLVGWISETGLLEKEVRLEILSNWSKGKLPSNLDRQDFQTDRGRDWYGKGVRKFQEAASGDLAKQVLGKELDLLEAWKEWTASPDDESPAKPTKANNRKKNSE